MNNRLPAESVPVSTSSDETLLLDLLNSTPVVDGVETDALAQWAAAREWMQERSIAPSKPQLEALRQVRALLQDVVRGTASPTVLSAVLDRVRYRATVDDSAVQWSIEAPAGYEVAARCVLAWDHLQRNRPGRLRPCANSACHLFLIDRSKPNTARWCSMAVCGNRMKARRHHERQRGH